jgi:hypothetical protein
MRCCRVFGVFAASMAPHSLTRPATRIVTFVRRARSLLLASALLALVAASSCTSTGTVSGSAGTVGASPATASASPVTNPTPSAAPDTATTPASNSGGDPADPPDPGSPPAVLPTDVPVDPVERVLTGTVRRTGSCTVLLVGDRRWPLIGDLAGGLIAGRRVTVSGPVYPLSGACSAAGRGPAIRVTSVQPA